MKKKLFLTPLALVRQYNSPKPYCSPSIIIQGNFNLSKHPNERFDRFFSMLCHKFFASFCYYSVVNALLHKLLLDPYQSRYNSQTINTKTQAGSHRVQCQHGRKLSKRSIFQLMCIYRYMINVKLIFAFTGFEQIYIILVKLITICS